MIAVIFLPIYLDFFYEFCIIYVNKNLLEDHGMKKWKVGLVGCGGIANGKHMPSLKKVPDCEMVAFCDIIVERAEKAKADAARSPVMDFYAVLCLYGQGRDDEAEKAVRQQLWEPPCLLRLIPVCKA